MQMEGRGGRRAIGVFDYPFKGLSSLSLLVLPLLCLGLLAVGYDSINKLLHLTNGLITKPHFDIKYASCNTILVL